MSPSSNKSFTQPPPDLPLSTPDLYRFHATHNPEHALYEYADSDGHSTVRTIAYREAYTAILHAAERVRGLYAPDGHTSERPVLAILAVADSITYLTTIVGAMTTGVASFPLSPRNSPAAIAHLLKTSSARRVLVSSDAAMQALMQEAITIFEATNSAVEVCGMPSFEELFVSGDARIPREEDVRIYERGRDAELLFMHSSGTTSFPKIIKFRDDNFVKWGLPFYDDPRLCGMRLGIHALPIFHTMGLIGVILPLTVGAIMCTFKPVSPPLVATTSNVLDGVIATKTDIPYVVPYFIEEWTKSPEQLKLLKSVKAVMYAGAALDKRIGDSLVELGIQLTLIYASTEAGCLNHILSPPDETNWEYFRMASHFDLALVPQDGQPGVFEPVILSNENWSPNVTNVVHNGRVGYSTGDLLLEHPRYPGYYKVFGRADEQLVLATGEKTNPLPLEGILKQDTHIENAIFFGHGRMSNGVLVQPKDPFNASDEKRLIEFRNKIWPTVVKMNNHAPQHSRIFKEMIMLTSPTKPLEVTPKGTPRRGVSLKAYESEIERLYATAAESAQDDLTSPSRWTPESAQAFVREAVRKVMRVPVEDGADLFQSGCDSLQATWIRNTIIRALRESTPVPTHTIPMSFVYSYPTVNALACYVSDLASGDSHKRGEGAKAEAKVELMRKLVDKFSRFEKPHVEALAINGNASSASAVLLTGSTGRLGCHLLAQLAACVDIARIFAVNRGSGSIDMLRKRQENMLRECGVDIPPENFRKITFVICNFGREKLGLDDEVYDQISQSVTSIIHNAWKVDFNANLDAFEPLLKGVQSIVELASRSAHKPSIFFVSSILSLQSLEPDGKPAPERASDDPHVALGTAYGESKWIAEQILSRGRAELGLRTSFARVTQLGGDSTSGIWSTREFVPKLVRLGSKLLGTLPSKDDVIDWLPVDTAASIVREVLSADEPTMNFAAVSPVPWDSIFGAFADALAIPLIPLAQWAANLRQAVDDIATEGRTLSEEDAQAFSLVDFALSEDFGKPSQRFETTAARRASSILACAPGFGAEDARRSVEYWRKSGFV